jgi:trehalose 6-phosphate synthase/phosphatase
MIIVEVVQGHRRVPHQLPSCAAESSDQLSFVKPINTANACVDDVPAEFVGCSPSLSGAIRVNPWSIDAVADAMFSAIKTSPEHRSLRHDKHWKCVTPLLQLCPCSNTPA